jgi:hypothetical protein
MHLKLTATIASVLALSLAASVALAQPAAGGGGGRGAALRAACAADFQKFCPNVQMGPDMRKCVRSNFNSLSDSCKAVLEQMRSHRQESSPQGGGAAPQ